MTRKSPSPPYWFSLSFLSSSSSSSSLGSFLCRHHQHPCSNWSRGPGIVPVPSHPHPPPPLPPPSSSLVRPLGSAEVTTPRQCRSRVLRSRSDSGSRSRSRSYDRRIYSAAAWSPLSLLRRLWSAVVLVVLVVILGATASSSSSSSKGGDDPYQILGVPRKATVQQIKAAYRRKARDTHPDKNRGVDPDVAAAEFRSVVDAFELLSDEQSRRRYDSTGRRDGGRGGGGGSNGRGRGGEGASASAGGWSFQFRNGRYYFFRTQGGGGETYAERQKRMLKNRSDVRQAQSRVMHVVSMEQLRTIMLDDDDLLERSLIICFVTPGVVETVADDDILFPYPFAGMSSQSIWWEDILQTMQVRYHRSNDLTRHFGVPDGDELTRGGKPHFVFVRKGRPLSEYHSFSTSDKDEFVNWIWRRLNVSVDFVNNHTHPVELYWINGNSGTLKGVIKPKSKFGMSTMLSHEFYVRDARVDTRHDSPHRNRLSKNSSLGSWKILNDEDQEIVIETKDCVDWSGHCEFWSTHPRGECDRNPDFMKTNCRLTCGACNDKEEEGRRVDKERSGGREGNGRKNDRDEL